MKKLLLALTLFCIGNFQLQANSIHVINCSQDALEFFIEEKHGPDLFGINNGIESNEKSILQPHHSIDFSYINISNNNRFLNKILGGKFTINIEIKNKDTQQVLYRCNQEHNKSVNDMLLNNKYISLLFEINEKNKVSVWQSLDTQSTQHTPVEEF